MRHKYYPRKRLILLSTYILWKLRIETVFSWESEMEYSDSVQFLTIIIIIENVQPGSIMVEYLHIIGVMGDTKEKVNNTINSHF